MTGDRVRSFLLNPCIYSGRPQIYRQLNRRHPLINHNYFRHFAHYRSDENAIVLVKNLREMQIQFCFLVNCSEGTVSKKCLKSPLITELRIFFNTHGNVLPEFSVFWERRIISTLKALWSIRPGVHATAYPSGISFFIPLLYSPPHIQFINEMCLNIKAIFSRKTILKISINSGLITNLWIIGYVDVSRKISSFMTNLQYIMFR